MEVDSAPAAAKRMWSYLRAVFFMVRKGLLSNKRKLLISMHLLMKRRNKAVERTVASLLSHHHHYHGSNHALRRRDYEFSCSNSPDPGSSSARRRHAYFPCLGAVTEADEDLPVASPAPPLAMMLEYYAASSSSSTAPSSPEPELLVPGAFSVRVSNYSSEDEGAGSAAVDDDAEEFIRRFYDQLRTQNTIALLPYYMQESAA